MPDTNQPMDEAIAWYVDRRASVPFFVLAMDGDIVKANTCARHVTGRDLTGENIRKVIIDFAGTFDPAAFSRDSAEEHLLHVGTASGLPQSFYFTFRQSGDRILMFGRLDADELETMRREILALNQELNHLTRELHQKNAQLTRLNDEKNRFLGMAAHDLRKPIGLIMTYSDFLLEEASRVLSTEHVGFLNTIHASSAFMKRVVDDFLDVSAIEAGRLSLDLQPASMADVLEKSLAFNRLQALKKGIVLEIGDGGRLPRVLMDAAKIEQVVINLVSNAIEHTPPDSRISITLSHDQGFIMVAVTDEGPGIPPEEQEKLFTPFGKTRVRKTSGEKSTGLGLLITRKIIEAHDGQIGLDSQTGKGTTFFFRLPIGWEAKNE